ncbi:MAG: hypothetical protein RL368_332, partial [Pseudomonadota bacterium]
MIYQSELKIEQALQAITLHKEVRRLLIPSFTGQVEWFTNVKNIIAHIETAIEKIPEEYSPKEWKLMIAGLRVLSSQMACEKIAET